jgi:hypothetical protein
LDVMAHTYPQKFEFIGADRAVTLIQAASSLSATYGFPEQKGFSQILMTHRELHAGEHRSAILRRGAAERRALQAETSPSSTSQVVLGHEDVARAECRRGLQHEAQAQCEAACRKCEVRLGTVDATYPERCL